ncbi:MAG: cytochrome C oxidase subunit IV family protein [Gemmatimonadales bacterium]
MSGTAERTVAPGSVAEAGGPSFRFYVLVWVGLMGIVVVEVFLTYAGLTPRGFLLALLSLAVIEAAIALLYFMHLRYERRILFWSLIPALVFVLVLFDHLWPDAFRVTSMRLPVSTSGTPPGGTTP